MINLLKYMTIFLLIIFSVSCAVKEPAIYDNVTKKEETTVAPKQQPKVVKTALVLGAGAVKGFAHVGVLKALEAHRIPINIVVGTSAGSFVGALYAYGYSGYELQKMSFELKRDDIADITLVPDTGFVKGDKIEQLINKLVNKNPIEKFKIPFAAVSADLETGEEIYFAKGNAGFAVRASCSVPGLFKPAKFNGKAYIDGGVVSPVAVDLAKKLGADVVIAVDLSSDVSQVMPVHFVDVILQSLTIMYSKLSKIQLERADVVIRPRVGRIGGADFSLKHEAVLEGEKAALESIPKILEKIKQKS